MEHISSGTESTDVDATTISESNELAAPPTQITSIDGFFNRKRGRPPKNRFVEVYKSAQHSPQAIFTSFKLEKNDLATCVPLAAPSDGNEERLLATLRLGGGTTQTISAPSAADLTPGRNSRKRARVWTVDSPRRSLANGPNAIKATSTQELPESRTPIPLMFSMQAAASSKSLERVSVVRAAGTFYPENASAAAAAAGAATAAVEQSAGGNSMSDQPEDLSMRAVQQQQTEPEPETVTAMATATSMAIERETETETGIKLMQFKQLLDLYQRQVLLPSFLAAGQLDMRLLLEQAAQQKMLLINAAAAVAATATAAAGATTASTSSAGEVCAPKPNSNSDSTATATATATSRVSVKRARDQDIPSGYLKFRFNEDCKFERCGYRNHQSHFHCNRRDCHYSFCDKTRFVQHTARHERMDTLMGDDFRQYRANMRCHVTDCTYATSSTSATGRSSKEIIALPLP
ncbi:uncharacterized protein LOC6558937 isoform X2 [Drosophila grimshawi]|uniref:uncharacterized protein LOC6558937 isoform X2 n=1 Tax=Drosophila grimshawi TaxID=7222 RepID=UPI000C86F6EA|nr:uncharacterized protein LOC6558937 isoform X2 [Drosophila grimshawi]